MERLEQVIKVHTYSTDNDLRPKVYAVLAAVALVTTTAANTLFSRLFSNLPISISIAISWGLIFGLVWRLYDRWLWKTRIASTLGATKTPNLNGEWAGWIQTSYEGEIPDEILHPENEGNEDGQRLKATIHIEQTWRKINIHFQTDQSHSDSNGATILTEEGRWPSISYQYENPGSTLVEGLDMHFGTASLEYRDDSTTEVLEGLYYTGPGRDNHGHMYFERQR